MQEKPYQIGFQTICAPIKGHKIIGLLGGMSLESAQEYKDIIYRNIKRHIPEISETPQTYLVEAVFDLDNYIKPLMDAGKWDIIAKNMTNAFNELRDYGAEIGVIATNTIHKVAPQIEANINIPLLHIADPTAEAIKAKGLKEVLLLGTKFTMEDGFYAKRLHEKHGITALIPKKKKDRNTLHNIIFDELVHGAINPTSKQELLAIIDETGAKGAILGCTELGMLIKPKDTTVELFDTAALHAHFSSHKALQTVQYNDKGFNLSRQFTR